MVTQKHIADSLGISIVTVSRALRGHPDLADETKERILTKATELGYPRSAPRSFAGATSRRIGVVLYQIGGSNFLDSELHRRIFGALEAECRGYGVEVVLQFPRPGEVPSCVLNQEVDAVCLLGRYTPEAVRFAQDIPTLSVASFTPGAPISRVVPDNTAGIAETTEHLIGLGHRRILMLSMEGGRQTGTYRHRIDGYLAAMGRHGLAPAIHNFPPTEELSIDPGLAQGYTAVVCSSDGIALNLLRRLEESGIAVPGAVSLTGFDDLQGAAQRGLTTYAPDWEAMGRLVAFLLSYRPQETLRSGFHLTVPGKLVVRRSTAAP